MENQRLKYLFLAFGWFIGIMTIMAQHPMTDQIILRYQEHQDPKIALQEMAQSVSKEEKKLAFVMYTEGFLLKECYKKNPAEDIKISWRDQSIEKLQQALLAQPDAATRDNIQKAQKFLLGTYFNDALIAARSFQSSNEALPYQLFEKFEKKILQSQTDQPVNALKSQFYKKLAERHYELWQPADTILIHPKSCINLYQKVLLQDPTDCEALHNLAVLYYNIGVNKIKNVPSQAEMDQLIQLQEEAIGLFRQALPFAESTFQDCPKTLSQYKALMYIQKALGNDEAFERLQTEVQQLFPND